MKSFIAALAFAIPATSVMAVPTSTPAAERKNFVFSKIIGAAQDTDQMCFDFSSEGSLSGFYYTFQGPWGSGSGQAGSQGSICVPTNNTAGGAMFIGDTENPGPGSTKLECYFPTTGTANCDVSLVDGYSIAVGCTTPGTPEIGGYSLLGSGYNCPDQQGPNCINTEGYAPSQSDVDPFFQTGVNNGNNYCIWVNCGQDYYFSTGSQISCSVTL